MLIMITIEGLEVALGFFSICTSKTMTDTIF